MLLKSMKYTNSRRFLLTVHLLKRLSYSHIVDLLEYFFTFFSSDHSISFHLLCWNVLISRNTNVLFLTHPNTAGCYWWFQIRLLTFASHRNSSLTNVRKYTIRMFLIEFHIFRIITFRLIIVNRFYGITLYQLHFT